MRRKATPKPKMPAPSIGPKYTAMENLRIECAILSAILYMEKRCAVPEPVKKPSRKAPKSAEPAENTTNPETESQDNG